MTTPTAQPEARLAWLADALHTVAALNAADGLGVLTRLESGPANAATVAADCAISSRGALVLLDALDALGLVDRIDHGRFQVAAPGATQLVRSLAGSLSVSDVIRHGKPAYAGDTAPGAAALYPGVVTHLASLAAAAAGRVAELISRPGAHILDAGTGAAPWSIALASRDPSCRITALDLDAVLPATRRAVADAGLAHRFRFLAGDVFTAQLGGQYDLVLLANVCHLFDPPTNQVLLSLMRRVLHTGGAVAIIDVLPSLDPDLHRAVSLYALGLLQRTQTGGVHKEQEYRRWLLDAGFGPANVTLVNAYPPLSLILAPVAAVGPPPGGEVGRTYDI